MITVKDIAEKSMTPDKKASAQSDLFAFYVIRPLSYVCSVPFMYMNISPNMISLISIIPVMIGFVISWFTYSKGGMLVSWLMFFIWDILDSVDGNVARYKKQLSKLGSVYDAMSGYLEASFVFFSAGIMAAHSTGPLVRANMITPEILVILGGVTAVMNMYPRLVMHKTVTTLMDKGQVRGVSEKKEYGIVKIIALNLKSCAGGALVLFLLAILLNLLDLYTIFYLLFNVAVMFVTIRSILKGNE